jgi:ABC-type methionine transport system permease subunit
MGYSSMSLTVFSVVLIILAILIKLKQTTGLKLS